MWNDDIMLMFYNDGRVRDLVEIVVEGIHRYIDASVGLTSPQL